MSRVARKSYETSYFHVIVQGYEKEPIFSKNEFKSEYLRLLREELNHFSVEILAYCIMDNHAHILLYCQTIEQMSFYMKSINSKYATYYNEQLQRVGYVFRDRFLSEPIMTQQYLYSCISYIHYNPVVARMVVWPTEYRFSSYNDFINKTGIITDDVLVKIFGNSDNYINMFYFIHYESGMGKEFIKDAPRLSVEEAKKCILNELQGKRIDDLKRENYKIQKEYFKKFIEKGISLYQLERILQVDHRKIKRLLALNF